MAKLVAVCRSEDFQCERRQIPLVIDESLTVVVQFADKCIDCDHVYGVKCKDLERFVQKFSCLSKDEIAVAMMVTGKDIMNLLTHLVPCVGCRRSVERLFNQLVVSQHPALDPLLITKSAVMSISRNHLFDPRALYSLFYIHGKRLSTLVDAIPKSKKNKRCNLHSLEKTRTTGSWIDIWDLLSQECREEVVLIDSDSLLETLENYLRKHRFCSECKSKVLRAYSILVGETDSTKEKGYCPALYEGLRCCPQERHIHMVCDTDFIAHLIGRAEPELAGSSRRDRHAKTLDIAQEEVLTCLGIHTYERLHKIWTKLKAEEQTWQILFYLGLDALKQSFEMALEKKQGVSNLELMCEEILEEERVREQRQEKKRQKKKKKKAKSGQLQNNEKENQMINDQEEEESHCKCDNNSPVKNKNLSNACISHHDCSDYNSNTSLASMESCRNCDPRAPGRPSPESVKVLQHDYGYSSSIDGCESCSMPSSNDGSDIACSDSVCNGHDDDHMHICNSEDTSRCPMSEFSLMRRGNTQSGRDHECASQFFTPKCRGDSSKQGQYKMTFSLKDMLEQSCSSEEEEISQEEIMRFKANEKKLLQKRQELRETLRRRFDNMQQQQQRESATLCGGRDLERLAQEIYNL